MGSIGKQRYPDLGFNEAIAKAEQLYSEYGGGTIASNFAKILGLNVSGGAFRERVRDMKQYGLVDSDKEGYKLTPLGLKIVQDSTDLESRREAFLSVTLFKDMHERLKGTIPEKMGVFIGRLKEIGLPEKEVLTRATRLRNRYNEALPYLNSEKSALGEPVKPSVSHNDILIRGQATSPTVPQDYEKLIGTDFVIGTRKDLEAIEMLEAQVGPWIAALKKKLSGTTKRAGVLAEK